jgi:hypothetical protein
MGGEEERIYSLGSHRAVSKLSRKKIKKERDRYLSPCCQKFKPNSMFLYITPLKTKRK